MTIDLQTGEIIRERTQNQRTERSNRSNPVDPDRFWDFLCAPIIVFWITLSIIIYVYLSSDYQPHKIISLFGETYAQSAESQISEIRSGWNFSCLVAVVSFVSYLISVIKFAVESKLLNPLKANRGLLNILIRNKENYVLFFYALILIIDFRFLFFFFQNWIYNGEPNIWLRWCIALLPIALSFCLILEAFGLISKAIK
ncbi:MAG: hypothetical protein LBG58_00205 [Planctomycetaceae bacterium]|jgi:hypothetical protein|nr:hypothetical protein [Planctomycetaceae bacterium]